MDYTQLTTKDLIGHTQSIIKDFEGKCHALELQIAMNRTLKAHYLGLKPNPNKAGSENARQQIAKDATALLEMQIGLPSLLAHLAELQELDAAEDAAREATTEPEADSVSDLDTGPIDLTDEAEQEPVPTPMRPKTVRRPFSETIETPAASNHADARELVPV